mgnify:CR=1 FL=1
MVPNQYDEFNGAAAIDGNTAILSDQDYSVGSIKIFSESNGVWSVDQIVNNPDTNTIAFGFFDVDLSGDYAIVSADNTAFFLKKDSGSGIWNVQQQVFHDNPSSYTLFGRDVKIDGDIAIVSAERDSELNSNVGAVFVYKRDSNE